MCVFVCAAFELATRTHSHLRLYVRVCVCAGTHARVRVVACVLPCVCAFAQLCCRTCMRCLCASIHAHTTPTEFSLKTRRTQTHTRGESRGLMRAAQRGEVSADTMRPEHTRARVCLWQLHVCPSARTKRAHKARTHARASARLRENTQLGTDLGAAREEGRTFL